MGFFSGTWTRAVLDANYGSAIAVVIALVGSVIGYQVSKLFGFGGTSHREA